MVDRPEHAFVISIGAVDHQPRLCYGQPLNIITVDLPRHPSSPDTPETTIAQAHLLPANKYSTASIRIAAMELFHHVPSGGAGRLGLCEPVGRKGEEHQPGG